MGRLIVSIFIGGVIAFALFVLMAELISNSGKPPPDPGKTVVIDIVMNTPDDATQLRQRVPPPPPPPEPEGKIVDKAKAASDTARRAGRKGSTLNKVSGGGLGTINRPSAGGDNDKLG